MQTRLQRGDRRVCSGSSRDKAPNQCMRERIRQDKAKLGVLLVYLDERTKQREEALDI